MESKKSQSNKGGRKPSKNPKIHRYVFRLTAFEQIKFLNRFQDSGMRNKAKFITAVLLEKQIKTVRVDLVALQYHASLVDLLNQFRAVGVNYNQIVKKSNQYFSENRAGIYLGKLENHTTELVALGKQIILLTKEFEKKHLHQNTTL